MSCVECAFPPWLKPRLIPPWPSLAERHQGAPRGPLEGSRDSAIRELRLDDHTGRHEALTVLVLRLRPVLLRDICAEGLPCQSLARGARTVLAHGRNKVEDVPSAPAHKKILLRSSIHARKLLLGVIGDDIVLVHAGRRWAAEAGDDNCLESVGS